MEVCAYPRSHDGAMGTDMDTPYISIGTLSEDDLGC